MRTKGADVVSHQSALVLYLITNKTGMIFLNFWSNMNLLIISLEH